MCVTSAPSASLHMRLSALAWREEFGGLGAPLRGKAALAL